MAAIVSDPRARLPEVQRPAAPPSLSLPPYLRTPSLAPIFEDARQVAGFQDVHVLLCGETGVGKEILARYVHDHSSRANQNFVAVNCAGLPDGLLESMLFGHARGAFTGAQQQTKGFFEAAQGGTLFLDEIGAMPLAQQATLLRVLETGEFYRLGAAVPIQADVRIVAATNRDPEEAIRSKTLAPDLYYRLQQFVIAIPPLRERPEDILPLAEYFLGKVAEEYRRPPLHLSEDAAGLLLRHAWPGNVRELKNAMIAAFIRASGGGAEEIEPRYFVHDNKLSSVPAGNVEPARPPFKAEQERPGAVTHPSDDRWGHFSKRLLEIFLSEPRLLGLEERLGLKDVDVVKSEIHLRLQVASLKKFDYSFEEAALDLRQATSSFSKQLSIALTGEPLARDTYTRKDIKGILQDLGDAVHAKTYVPFVSSDAMEKFVADFCAAVSDFKEIEGFFQKFPSFLARSVVEREGLKTVGELQACLGTRYNNAYELAKTAGFVVQHGKISNHNLPEAVPSFPVPGCQ